MEQRTPALQYSSTPILQHSDVSVVLRGHHLLCLHGFRGFGYSPEFVSNMQLVRDRLASSPDVEVEVTTSPDDICSACPHLQEGKCARDGGDSETRTREKDTAVLARLALSPGDKISSGELFALTAERFSNGIEDLCSLCKWFPLGWCAEGIGRKVMEQPSARACDCAMPHADEDGHAPHPYGNAGGRVSG